MSRVFLSISVVLLLAGCATVQPQLAGTVPHHRTVAKPAPILAPITAPEAPKQKTFRQKWLSKFFRDRAVK